MRRLCKPIGLMLMIGMSLSCSESIEPTPYNYTKVFSGEISKMWNLKRVSFKKEGDSEVRFTLQDCLLDDEYIFYRDSERKFEFKTGSKKCDPTDESITDTWSFNNANATLYVLIPILADIPLPYTVVDVDKNDLELQIYLDEARTQSYLIKFESDDY